MNKEIRKQLTRAERDREHFRTRKFTGHTWGQIECRTCGNTIKVYSTGNVSEQGAKYLRKFIDKHRNH